MHQRRYNASAAPFNHLLQLNGCWLGAHAPRIRCGEPRDDWARCWDLYLSVGHLLVGHSLESVARPSRSESSSSPYCVGANSVEVSEHRGHVAKSWYPVDRRVIRLPAAPISQLDEATEWAAEKKIKLGPLIPEHLRPEVLLTLFAYRELDGTVPGNLPATDLYMHRIRISEEQRMRPWNRSKKKRWTEQQDYWLNKLLQEGLSHGLYEYTMNANGKLSDWAAEPVIVEKDGTKDSWDEKRLTFNYRNVHETMPATAMTQLSDIHEYLSDTRHGSFSTIDLKNAYWSIAVHPDDRHIFAFSVPGYGQLQPTRMPQGSQSASFSMDQYMNVALGPIPSPSPEPSLLSPTVEGDLAPCKKYVDDIFMGGATFEYHQWPFFKNHLLPRLLFARARVTFGKVALGMDEVLALGWTHQIHGIIKVKESRAAKLREFPVPMDASGVRAFLGSLGPCRRWIKNVAEIARPLNRLTGDVDWRWGPAEAASFSLLRQLAADAVELHGRNPNRPSYLYSDASAYAAGCVITQHNDDGVEVPLLYDGFTFTKCQQNYGTYKRELCAIQEFCRRYAHYFSPHVVSIIYTDHKPLVHFLSGSSHDGIYSRWATELRLLPVEIRWISGARNEVADALSRTLFEHPDCEGDADLLSLGQLDGGGGWIWKDGKNGYADLLARKSGRRASVNPETGTLDISSVAARFSELSVETGGRELVGGSELPHLQPSHVSTFESVTWPLPVQRLLDSSWYAEVARVLLGIDLDQPVSRVHRRLQLRRARLFRFGRDGMSLFRQLPSGWALCILEEDVAITLHKVHDQEGHLGPSFMMKVLQSRVWWPSRCKDVVEYYAGCLQCAKMAPRQPAREPVTTVLSSPFQVWVADHIGPFPESDRGFKHILTVIDGFSRFVWARPCISTTAEEAIEAIEDIVGSLGCSPLVVYSDAGSAFMSSQFGSGMAILGSEVVAAPSHAHKSVGIVEIVNKLIQEMQVKLGHQPGLWDRQLPRVIKALNRRVITGTGFSPLELLYGIEPRLAIDSTRHTRDAAVLAIRLRELGSTAFEVPTIAMIDHIARRHASFDRTIQNQSATAQARHDRHLTRNYAALKSGQLVLWSREGKAPKLQSRWRGPYRLGTQEGVTTWRLLRVDGAMLRHAVHHDHLKPFVPRSDRLEVRQSVL